MKPYDSSNKVHVKAAKQKAAVLGEISARGMQKIINDPDCMAVLREFLHMANPMQDNYLTNDRDHAHAAGWAGAGWWWIQKGLLQDSGFIGKLQHDDGSLYIESQDDDGHNDFNGDDSSNSG